MKILLSKDYLDKFAIREVVKSVHKKFDEYNYKVYLPKNYFGKTTTRVKEVVISPSFTINDSVLNTTIKREELLKEIKAFNSKIKYLKSTLTDDEKIIFKFGIEQRLTIDELADALAKSTKTTKKIRKSCYIKVALYFNLLNTSKVTYRSKRANIQAE